MDDAIPQSVIEAWGLDGAAFERVSVGWINRTYRARSRRGPLIVQRLHPAFTAPVNDDIDVITRHLEARGMLTPRVVPTDSGALCVAADGCWRALSFIEGRAIETLDDARLARSAAALAGRFHAALVDLEHRFAFTRPGAHDTRAHVAKLARLRAAHPDRSDVASVADALLAEAESLEIVEGLPLRIVHGDLKATNFLFAVDEPEARAIVDLDTLAHGTLDIELGDAMRSWCNQTSEADPGAVFDAQIFAAAMEGYASVARDLPTDAELRALVPSTRRICVELACRFAADVYEDRYFGWDQSRFSSRVEHNLSRAHAQLSLGRSVAAQAGALEEAVREAFGRPLD